MRIVGGSFISMSVGRSFDLNFSADYLPPANPMSSKRGRKRNDNLPPNRARDVQRAFRARRAAHLHALEERVSELEEENNCLRLALRLPPSVRPPLGKGPTGKDRSKAYENNTARSLGFNSGAGSSDGHSPASRASSISPSGIGVSMSSSTHPMTVIDASWDESIILTDHNQNPTQHSTEVIQPSSDMNYNMTPMATPMAAPMAVKPTQTHYTYNESFASSSRSLSHMYSGSPAPYQNSSRPMGSNYGNQAFIRGDIREESRQQYPYSQSYTTPHDTTSAHSQTPSPSLHVHSSHNIQPSRESPLPYPPPPHRRSVTDPLGYSLGQGFPHLPNPAQPQQQHSTRSSEYNRPLDNHDLPHGGQPPRPNGPYAQDGRLSP